MHLSVVIPGGEGELHTRMGGLDCFCIFVAGSPGEGPWDL